MPSRRMSPDITLPAPGSPISPGAMLQWILPMNSGARITYLAQRVVTYVAHAATGFSESAISAMQNGSLRAVLFFSARTAAIYAALVQKHGLEDVQKNIDALCLSGNIGKIAGALPFAAIRWPKKTNTQALLDEVISHVTSR